MTTNENSSITSNEEIIGYFNWCDTVCTPCAKKHALDLVPFTALLRKQALPGEFTCDYCGHDFPQLPELDIDNAEEDSIYAYIYRSNAYCEDCLQEYVLGKNKQQERAQAKRGELLNISLVHENTVQYEQYPGEIIPLEGIYCCKCNAELYAPMETEEE